MPADITTDRLLAAVTWEWQDVEDLMEQLIPTVPPGKALRKYQVAQENYRKQNPDVDPRLARPLSEDEQIASGARTIVNDRIGAQVSSGRLEIERADGRRRVRFRERREVVDTRGHCRTCNRPFDLATEKTPPVPSRRPKVVYPHFPQWNRQLDEGSSG